MPTKRKPGRPSNAALITKVETELLTYIMLAVSLWSAFDEECTNVLFETTTIPGPDGPQEIQRLEAIVNRIVLICARNERVLKFLANGAILGDFGVLATLLAPMVKQVYRHHGPGARLESYPAYEPAK